MPDPTPANQIQPLQGKTTIDDKMFFEPERLSYEAARGLADKIAAALAGECRKGHIVIASTGLLSDFANYHAVTVLVDLLTRDYQALATQAEQATARRAAVAQIAPAAVPQLAIRSLVPAITPVAAIATGLNAALGLVSMFRQDVSFFGAKTVIDSLAFQIAIAARLKAMKFEHVIVPDLAVLSQPAGGSALNAKLQDLEQAKSSVWSLVTPLVAELVELDTELDVAARASNQSEVDRLTTEVNQLRRDLSPVTEPLAAIDQRLSALQADWQKSDPDTGLTGFARLLRAEAVQALNPVYLHGKVVSSGGHHRISRSLFSSLFTGDGLSFKGGAVVRWALLNSGGEVLLGDLSNCSIESR
jgi:hypothetical protein